ncbi:ZirU family protein [Ectopseudomonas mendocina]|uniref:ZirU family protein n=1 Tax=Ectopseudomonas mendocina TaxID=300 RepID=A0ABZ2RK70_ECTME
MKFFTFKNYRKLITLAAGMSFTACALAEITSSPTSTVKGAAPVVTNPAIISFIDSDSNGIVNTGDALHISWNLSTDVSDTDGDEVVEATYQWFAGSTPIGTGTELIINSEHLGKSITVKAVAKTDPSTTDPYQSLETLAVLDGSVPGAGQGGTEIPVTAEGAPLSVVIDGLVDGAPKVGQALSASVICEGACTGLTYQWQIESAIGSGSFINISGASNQSYTPVKGDQKRQIQVLVDQ